MTSQSLSKKCTVVKQVKVFMPLSSRKTAFLTLNLSYSGFVNMPHSVTGVPKLSKIGLFRVTEDNQRLFYCEIALKSDFENILDKFALCLTCEQWGKV
jgi:hypothetical protein